MLALLAFALTVVPPPSPPPPPVIAIRAAAMLDVAAGRLVRDPVVIVEGERIRAAGPALAIPAGAEVIELRAATLLPGLIDAHTHITTTYRFLLMGGPMHEAVTAHVHARKTLEKGITSVRDLWSAATTRT